MRAKTIALLLAAAALVVPASAQAHISLHPNTIPAGAFATLDVRVPGEQEGAYVKKVDMLFPPGFTGVDYENVPGWSTKVIETKLATPIKEGGETINTEVSQIVWTWTGPLGKVNNGAVHQVPALARDPGRHSGQGARIQDDPDLQQRPGRALDRTVADRRTPRAQDQRDRQGRRDRGRRGRRGRPGSRPGSATTQATPAPSTVVVKSSSGASKGLGITALILGALGLLAGLSALASSRRPLAGSRRGKAASDA